MQDDHLIECNCLDCLDPTPGNHVDVGYGENDEKLPYYLDATIIANKTAKIFSMPGASMTGSKVIRVVHPGDIIGKVFSWVKDKHDPRFVWIQLYNRKGYILLTPGLFDKISAVQTSSGKKFVDRMTAIDASEHLSLNNLPSLKFLGKFKYIMLAVAALLLTALFLRIKG